VPGQKKKIGPAAARAYKERMQRRPPQPDVERPAAFHAPSPAADGLGRAVGISLVVVKLWKLFRRGSRIHG
jgi:hypothetical protein